MKKPGKKKSRPRSQRRRRAHGARKPPHQPARPAPIAQTHMVGGEHGPGALYDDCPACRALRELGLLPDQSGVVQMTPQQVEAYQAKLKQTIAEDGWPDGAQWVSGEELQRNYDRINRELIARGYDTDLETMTDAQLRAHFDRVIEIGDELEATSESRHGGTGSALN